MRTMLITQIAKKIQTAKMVQSSWLGSRHDECTEFANDANG